MVSAFEVSDVDAKTVPRTRAKTITNSKKGSLLVASGLGI
jgi:hypothetical protein